MDENKVVIDVQFSLFVLIYFVLVVLLFDNIPTAAKTSFQETFS